MPYLLLAALILGSLGGWTVNGWRWEAKEKARLEAVARDRMRAEKNVDTAAVGHEADKEKIRTKFVVVTKEIERVVKEPFYAGADLCFDDSGMRQLRAAIRARPAASESATGLRGPSGTSGWGARLRSSLGGGSGRAVPGVPVSTSPSE